jgi:hypothetical protein
MSSVDSLRQGSLDERRRSGVRWAWKSTLLILLAAGVVAGAVSVRMWALQRAALDEIAAQPEPKASRADDTALVLGSIRRLRLVTIELATHVNAESGDASWRGDVKARIDAPVKLHFGTDLSMLKADSLRASALGNSWVVTVPPPERIATEVFGEREQTDVRVGWLRSRSMSGEKHLGLARRDLYAAARRLHLSDEDSLRVRAETRDQVSRLIRSIVGPWSSITVRFEDELPADASVGAGTMP